MTSSLAKRPTFFAMEIVHDKIWKLVIIFASFWSEQTNVIRTHDLGYNLLTVELILYNNSLITPQTQHHTTNTASQQKTNVAQSQNNHNVTLAHHHTITTTSHHKHSITPAHRHKTTTASHLLNHHHNTTSSQHNTITSLPPRQTKNGPSVSNSYWILEVILRLESHQVEFSNFQRMIWNELEAIILTPRLRSAHSFSSHCQATNFHLFAFCNNSNAFFLA